MITYHEYHFDYIVGGENMDKYLKQDKKVTLKKKIKNISDDKTVLLTLNECGGGFSS